MNRKKKSIEIQDKLVEGWEKDEKATNENADLLGTRSEIEYAKQKGKKILYLEDPINERH